MEPTGLGMPKMAIDSELLAVGTLKRSLRKVMLCPDTSTICHTISIYNYIYFVPIRNIYRSYRSYPIFFVYYIVQHPSLLSSSSIALPFQVLLASCVLLREVLYFLCTATALLRCPGFLLIDLKASWQRGLRGEAFAAVMMPEKFLGTAERPTRCRS